MRQGSSRPRAKRKRDKEQYDELLSGTRAPADERLVRDVLNATPHENAEPKDGARRAPPHIHIRVNHHSNRRSHNSH